MRSTIGLGEDKVSGTVFVDRYVIFAQARVIELNSLLLECALWDDLNVPIRLGIATTCSIV
jgi:hypothetical protein